MRIAKLVIPLALLIPQLALGANKETIELSRDVAQLQDQVRTLQRSFDEKLAALQTLVQQSLDASIRANNSVAVLNGRLNTGLKDLGTASNAPVVALGAKLDGVQQDMQSVRESVADLTARMGRIQQQLTDVNTALKAGAAGPPAEPPAPKMPLSMPPSQGAEPQAAAVDPDSGATAVPAGNPPVAATTLYDNAKRDLTSGKADLAMDEFRQYLKFYGKTEMAPNAQFYIGYIRMAQDKFDMAIIDFDRVLEKYPTNSKTAEAHYYKGKALFQLGQRTKAAKEFQAVVDEFPTTEVAQSAKTQLRALGLSPTPSTAKRRR